LFKPFIIVQNTLSKKKMENGPSKSPNNTNASVHAKRTIEKTTANFEESGVPWRRTKERRIRRRWREEEESRGAVGHGNRQSEASFVLGTRVRGKKMRRVV
jgi:hypothetical protein